MGPFSSVILRILAYDEKCLVGNDIPKKFIVKFVNYLLLFSKVDAHPSPSTYFPVVPVLVILH